MVINPQIFAGNHFGNPVETRVAALDNAGIMFPELEHQQMNYDYRDRDWETKCQELDGLS